MLTKENCPEVVIEILDPVAATWLLVQLGEDEPVRIKTSGNRWACVFEDACRVRNLLDRKFTSERREVLRRFLAAMKRLERLTKEAGRKE